MPLTQDAWMFDHNGSSKDQNPNYLCTITCTDQNITLVASLPQEFTTDLSVTYEEAFSQAVNNTPIISQLNGWAKAAGIQLTTQALTAKVWQGSSDFSFSLPLVFQAIDDEYKDVIDKIEQLYKLTLPDELFSNGFLTAPGPRLDPELLLSNMGDIARQSVDDIKGIYSKREELLKSGSVKGAIFGSDSKAAGTKTTTNSNRQQGAKRPLVSSVKNNISLQLGNYMFFESVVITNVSLTHQVQPLASGVMSQVQATVNFQTFYTPVKADIARIFRNSNSRSE